jgi:hypothetical protein
MDFPSSRAFEDDARLRARTARAGAGPLLALLLVGLLADVARPEEAYAGIDYGLSLLAFLGATGVVCLTSRLHACLDPLPGVGPAAHMAHVFASVPGLSARGERWPLLVALLFGPLVVLISGLGGWV